LEEVNDVGDEVTVIPREGVESLPPFQAQHA
jgi:hypothetical protein